MMPSMGILYGPRDAATVLMFHRHKVRRVWRAGKGGIEWAWSLDGQLVTLGALEDAAELHEPLRYRHTPRRPARAARPLRSVSVVTGLHRVLYR